MTTYRRRPVEIEAVQWHVFRQDNYPIFDTVPMWLTRALIDNTITIHEDYNSNVWINIETLEGVMRSESGDFLIQGIEGEIYSCKEKIFPKIYEKV